MDISKEIRKLLIDEEVSLTKLSEMLGTSTNNLNNKFRRNDMRISDIESMASALGYKVEVKFIKED